MDDYYAYLSHENNNHTHHPVDRTPRRNLGEKFNSAERLVEVEMHPVSTDVFASEYDRDDQQTESVLSEDGYVLDEERLSDVPSSSTSPVPSESAVSIIGASDSVSPVGGRSPTMPPHRRQTSQDLSSMNDGHFDTSDYASTNSSKDAVHSGDSCSASSAASLRSASPDGPSPASSVVLSGVTSTDANQFGRTPAHVSEPTSPTGPLDETPIERDIRQVTLRENELRLQQKMRLLDISEDEDYKRTFKKSIRPVVPFDHATYTNTQRLLATTRLQQEIEDQKRRELDLKRNGRVQSISEERTDHLDEDSAFDDHDSVATQLSSSSSLTTTVDSTLPKTTIKEQRAFFEDASRRPLQPLGILLKTPPRPGGTAPEKKTPVSVIPARLSSGTMKMPVSMERFISSRGKAAGQGGSRMVTSRMIAGEGVFSNGDHHDTYIDFSALRVQNTVDTSLTGTKKVYRTAKTKISEELREMEEREAELRRARLAMGLPAEQNELEYNLKTTENCTTPDTGKNCNDELAMIPKGRQSVLLAQWEARAQQ